MNAPPSLRKRSRLVIVRPVQILDLSLLRIGLKKVPSSDLVAIVGVGELGSLQELGGGVALGTSLFRSDC